MKKILLLVLISYLNLFATAKDSLDKTTDIVKEHNTVLKEENKILNEDNSIVQNTTIPLLTYIFEQEKTNNLKFEEE